MESFRARRKVTGDRWRLDETEIKVKGEARYLYRAVDKEGNTIDFLLTAKRDRKAATRFLEKAIGSGKEPSLINIDKSGANTAGINDYNDDHGTEIEIRQCKYLNNIVESDHWPIKRRIRLMMGFKSFWTARIVLAGIEIVRMIRKGQMKLRRGQCVLSDAELFYSLAT